LSTERKNKARIAIIDGANGGALPSSSGNGSLLAFGNIRESSVVALLFLASVGLTGGWVFVLGWMALRLINWILA
jgi:hypothetical protein